MAKLYSHVSRLLVRRKISRYQEAKLKWGLTLKPGDLVNDCTAFNVRIRSIEPDYIQTRKGWYIYDFTLTTEPNGGSCSLIHCGVIPAPSRAKVESDWLQWAEDYVINGYLEQWCGGDKTLFDEQFVSLDIRLNVIKNGGHITDEDGCLLGEYYHV